MKIESTGVKSILILSALILTILFIISSFNIVLHYKYGELL